MGKGEMKFKAGEPLAQGQVGVETEPYNAVKGTDSTNILRTILRTKTNFVPFYFLQRGRKPVGPEHNCPFSLRCFVQMRSGYFVL